MLSGTRDVQLYSINRPKTALRCLIRFNNLWTSLLFSTQTIRPELARNTLQNEEYLALTALTSLKKVQFSGVIQFLEADDLAEQKIALIDGRS